MGGKQSTNQPRVRTFSSSGEQVNTSRSQLGEIAMGSSVSSTSGPRTRARSLGNFHAGPHSSSLSIPTSNGGPHVSGSPDSDSSTPEDGGPVMFGRPFTNSLPVHLVALQGIKCPVCAKFVPPEDIECHLVICLTKPRISYNEDVLTEDKGECVICLDDLQQGDTIARLPCLCIYHKGCIDRWFEVNRSCPEHPGD